jgi:hypothetical protein
MQKLSRPLGVSIIANFGIILGIIMLLGVVIVSVSGVNMANTVASSRVKTAASSGSVGLEVALYILVVGYGLRKGKAWAWTMSIIGILIGFATTSYAIYFTTLPVIGVIGNQVGLTAYAGIIVDMIIISIIVLVSIELIILYYLYRPHVKAYFGKTTPSSS